VYYFVLGVFFGGFCGRLDGKEHVSGMVLCLDLIGESVMRVGWGLVVILAVFLF